MGPLLACRIVGLECCRRGQFLVVESGRYAGKMTPINVTEYDDDDAKDRDGLDEGGYL